MGQCPVFHPSAGFDGQNDMSRSATKVEFNEDDQKATADAIPQHEGEAPEEELRADVTSEEE